ncbi:MAG: Unknown protein [uncultured Aureispira sp.]|uniref:Uncharacterized protein n=1 Tax=uncultured Aureispira sp. TaxID=1331704 RepID=A0A6S6SES4_9BACT|nr:MAG: Unknown protein [uncultured Aureispira sp.]
MKLFYVLQVLFYAYLIHLGFYYKEVDATLWAEFSRVGWERYDGPELDYPENTYYLIWAIASLITTFVAWVFKLDDEDSALAQGLFFMGALFTIGYTILFFQDGSVSIKSSQMAWIFTSVFQIVMGIGGIFSASLAKIAKISLRQLFFLNGLLHLVALGLGFYFLHWDQTILAESNRLGELYEGLSTRFCENTYHFILMSLTIASLFLGNMIKAKELIYPMYQWLLIGFFLYSGFVVLNNGNPDMEETQYWWGSLTIITSILSFLIARTIENKLPERAEKTIYKDTILDDFSSLD